METQANVNSTTSTNNDQCPVTLTVSNLIVDSEKHLALQQERIQRRKHHLHHRKYHHQHEHVVGCPLHRQKQPQPQPDEERGKLPHEEGGGKILPSTDSLNHFTNNFYVNSRHDTSNNQHETIPKNESSLNYNSNVNYNQLHSLQINRNVENGNCNLQSNKNDKEDEILKVTYNKMDKCEVSKNVESQNLHSNYPHLVNHCYRNELQFEEQMFPGKKLSGKVCSTSTSSNSLSCNNSSSSSSSEQLQMVQVTGSFNDLILNNSRKELSTNEKQQQQKQQIKKLTPKDDEEENEFTTGFFGRNDEYKLRNGLHDEDDYNSVEKRSYCTRITSSSNIVTVLAVVAFIGLSVTILSNVTLNGKTTIARLEDSFSSSLTFLNDTFEKSKIFSLPSVTKFEITSGSNVLSKTSGLVYKSFYSTKGAAESLMAALTSLVSSSEKRKAQLASMKNRTLSSNEESKIDEQIDSTNGNSVLAPEEESNLVSVETTCTKYVGTIEDGSFAFKVSKMRKTFCFIRRKNILTFVLLTKLFFFT